MSNGEVEPILKNGFPQNLSGTAVAVYYVIAYRYDTRPGKKTSYPGMEELMLATTKSRSTIQRALAVLIKAGLVDQVQRGHRTKRAEYLPRYSLDLNNKSNAGTPHNYQDKASQLEAESVAPMDLLGGNSVKIVSRDRHPLSTPSNQSTESGQPDLARFRCIMKGVPQHLRPLVTPGNNFEMLFNELERKGTSKEAIREHLRANSWNGIEKPGGIVDTLLRQLLAIRSAKGEPTRPIWCGECDETTRKVLYAWDIPGGGKTFSCPTCSFFAMTLR